MNTMHALTHKARQRRPRQVASALSLSLSLSLSQALMPAAHAQDSAVQWTFDPDDGQLSVSIARAQPLENVLRQLARGMQFELELGQPHYPVVSGDFSGPAHSVLNRLARPTSIIISGSEMPPYRLSRVVLLPSGTEQSGSLPSGAVSGNPKTSGGSYTGPEHNREKLERRMNRGY